MPRKPLQQQDEDPGQAAHDKWLRGLGQEGMDKLALSLSGLMRSKEKTEPTSSEPDSPAIPAWWTKSGEPSTNSTPKK